MTPDLDPQEFYARLRALDVEPPEANSLITLQSIADLVERAYVVGYDEGYEQGSADGSRS